MFYNEDCITGCKKYIDDNTVDLIITDPPYGIEGDLLDRHYNRDEDYVLPGYVEVNGDYLQFSRNWIREAERILKPGGSMYVVSGYTNLCDILLALRETSLLEMNHIIWKYNFGVYTRKKYVSSHYHILYYVKPGKPHTFNLFCRYGETEKSSDGRALNYQDREDVWEIKREYHKSQVKNRNQLPENLLSKMILYSSDENDLVCDLFLGSFATAKAAIGLNRRVIGFEINSNSFHYHKESVSALKPGFLLEKQRKPSPDRIRKRGKPWEDREKKRLVEDFEKLRNCGFSKNKALNILSKRYERGVFSLMKIINSSKKK